MNMQNIKPNTGNTGSLPIDNGTLNGLGASGSFNLNSIIDALITKNVTKSVKLSTFATNAISPAKIKTSENSMVMNMATHGVLLAGCTFARILGKVEESAIP